jgi:hypothetical protein
MAAPGRRRGRRREAGVDVVRVVVLPDGRMDRVNAAKYLGRRPHLCPTNAVMVGSE